MRATMLTLALIGGALIASAGAARETDAERMQKALKGYVAGEEVDCIHQFPSLRSTTYENAILYEDGRTLYLNTFEGGCKLGIDTILVTRTYSGQLCRGDIAQIVDQAAQFPRGSCAFGKFRTYTKAK